MIASSLRTCLERSMVSTAAFAPAGLARPAVAAAAASSAAPAAAHRPLARVAVCRGGDGSGGECGGRGGGVLSSGDGKSSLSAAAWAAAGLGGQGGRQPLVRGERASRRPIGWRPAAPIASAASRPPPGPVPPSSSSQPADSSPPSPPVEAAPAAPAESGGGGGRLWVSSGFRAHFGRSPAAAAAAAAAASEAAATAKAAAAEGAAESPPRGALPWKPRRAVKATPRRWAPPALLSLPRAPPPPATAASAPAVVPVGVAPVAATEKALSLAEGHQEEVVPLDEMQREAVALALSGTSFFLTGEAGTGKSATLRAIITALTKRYGADAVGVTASTGLSAAALGGTTLHQWAGVGLGLEPVDELVQYMRKGARARWARTRVLLIDEVSMLSALFFSTVADVGAGVRRARRGEPFGGIQIIGVGDFLQLPPVMRSTSEQRWRGRVNGAAAGEACFAFQSPVWGAVFSRTVVLRQVHRQADPAFVAVLNEVRKGRLSAAGRAFLTSREVPRRRGAAVTGAGADEYADADSEVAAAIGADDRDTYVWLGSHKKSVALRNEARLGRIDRPAYVYTADDWTDTPGPSWRMSAVRSPEEVTLKVGARVICLKNVAIAKGVVNGAAGVVVDFLKAPRDSRRDANGQLVVGHSRGRRPGGDGRGRPPEGNPDDEMPLLSAREIAAIPYRGLHGKCLAYGVDVKALPNRQAVVLRAALTRRVEAIAFGRAAAAAAAGEEQPAIAACSASWPALSAPVYPLVRFDNGACALLLPVAEDVVDADGEVVASRRQLPLTLGWALTVHGAQGMSLDRVEVDLALSFEAGMVYVALSRARSGDGLRVASLDFDRVVAHPDALAFYEALDG